MPLEQQTALIVGVGPGLGWALTRRFMQSGMTVAAVARRPDKIRKLIEGEGLEGVTPFGCDVSKPEEVERLFDAVTASFDIPSVVIYNAGTFAPAQVVDIELQDFERHWRIGCFGGFLVGRLAARGMLESGQGTILFTGATASCRGGTGFANLAVPKFGLRALAQSMARELGPRGIHVAHVIIDGQIESERYLHLLEERGPDSLLKPEAIAEQYYQLYRQPRSAWTLELDLRPWLENF